MEFSLALPMEFIIALRSIDRTFTSIFYFPEKVKKTKQNNPVKSKIIIEHMLRSYDNKFHQEQKTLLNILKPFFLDKK